MRSTRFVLGMVALAGLLITSLGHAQPANDECTGAILIGNGVTAGSNLGATDSFPAMTCGAAAGAHSDVWYVYIPTCTGLAVVSTCPGIGSFPTVVEVVDNCSVTTVLGCDDDSCGSPTGTPYGMSTVIVPVTTGVPIGIRVAANGLVQGNFNLSISCQPPTPSNDECAGAIQVFTGATAGTNAGATNSVGPPSCSAIGRDVWFKYTASCSGAAQVTTCPPNGNYTYDMVISVFSGTCAALATLGCDDDSCGYFFQGTTVGWTATAGTTYYLRVGGWDPNNGGPPTPPYNGPLDGDFTLYISCGGAATADYGDAPAGLPTIASHTVTGERLGSVVTADPGPPLPAWVGDTGDDGLISATGLYPGSASGTIVVRASNPTATTTDYVALWVRTGAGGGGGGAGPTLPWAPGDLQPLQSATLGATPTDFTFGPFTFLGNAPTSPWVRVRLAQDSTQISTVVSAATTGEVEDYLIPGEGGPNTTGISGQAYSDAGDAPLPYPPVAVQSQVSERLGLVGDEDALSPVGFPTPPFFTGAWNDDGADDDCIAKIRGLTPGGTAMVDVTAVNLGPSAPTSNYLSMWMDFDGDGNWDEPGEAAAPINVVVAATPGTYTLSLPVPATAVNPIGTRIKLAYWNDYSLAWLAAGASTHWGEAEDYYLSMTFGQGCNTTPGPAATTWCDDPPRIGSTFVHKGAGFAPGAVVFQIVSGFSIPGGFDLGLIFPIPTGQCFLYVNLDVVTLVGAASPSGTISIPVPVPTTGSLVGVTAQLQLAGVGFPFAMFMTPRLPVTVLPQ